MSSILNAYIRLCFNDDNLCNSSLTSYREATIAKAVTYWTSAYFVSCGRPFQTSFRREISEGGEMAHLYRYMNSDVHVKGCKRSPTNPYD